MKDIIRTSVEHRVFPSMHGTQDSRGGCQEDRNYVPREMRLEFPHFDQNNPAEWIVKVTQYFEFHRTPLH